MKRLKRYDLKNIKIEEKTIACEDIFNEEQVVLFVMRMTADVKKLDWKHYHPIVAMVRVEADPKDRMPKEIIEKRLLETIAKTVLARKEEPVDDDKLDR